MEHNYNNNSGSGGYLLWILAVVLFLGNTALFTGAFSDIPLLYILTISGDVLVVGAIIKGITDKLSHDTSSQSMTDDQSSMQQDEHYSMQQDEPQNTYTDPPKTTSSTNDKRKLNRMKAKYRVQDIPLVVNSVDPLQKEMEAYQCVEILQSVNKVYNTRNDYIKKMMSIKEEIDEILSCPECSTDAERIRFIENNKEILQHKKEEYTDISKKIKNVRVVLLAKEKSAFNKLLSALSDVSSSEKSNSKSKVALSTFMKLSSDIPGDLFISEQAPIELDYGAYKFFLLPDIVLAYDKENTFVTALEPMALIITFENKKKNVYMHYNYSWYYSDSVVADDSKLIEEGPVRTSWLHERKDGGPDMRYSHNPMYKYRTDTYAYSYFSIQIGQYKAEYSLSKANLSDKNRPIVQEYCSVMHELNVIPSLLRLIESAAKKRDMAHLLSEQYESVSKNIICKVSLEEIQ